MKVLLADDSAFMRTIIKAALKDIPGLEFMEAENGDVAVELYKNYRFDVVFLDIIMPVKNGIMAMEEIRQINAEARIVIVSSVSQDELLDKAKALNANAFLPKPFQPEQIKNIFLEVTGQGGTGGQEASVIPVTTAPVAPAASAPAETAAPSAPAPAEPALASAPVAAPVAPEPVVAVAPPVAPTPVVPAPMPVAPVPASPVTEVPQAQPPVNPVVPPTQPVA